jgi:hypothetical protein
MIYTTGCRYFLSNSLLICHPTIRRDAIHILTASLHNPQQWIVFMNITVFCDVTPYSLVDAITRHNISK